MSTETQKQQARACFENLRDDICTAFEAIENDYEGPKHSDKAAGTFEYTSWKRNDDRVENPGGGTMGVMKGRVFEKVGVNISTVHGIFSDEFRARIPGTEESAEFWASGISLVAHMQSPFVPPVHMNLRHISTRGKSWFGGGADLNPITENKDDTNAFHDALKKACDKHDPDYYETYKKACDDYFFIPHRNEHRGVGGIFVDYHDKKSFHEDLAFIQDIGNAFLDIYPRIVRTHMNKDWNDQDRYTQLVKRGRYVEFNLLYDRGTTFGLKTGGNTDAILMSMPPEVIWE